MAMKRIGIMTRLPCKREIYSDNYDCILSCIINENVTNEVIQKYIRLYVTSNLPMAKGASLLMKGSSDFSRDWWG